MPAFVACPACGQKLPLSEKESGKKVQCPHCGQQLSVCLKKPTSDTYQLKPAEPGPKLATPLEPWLEDRRPEPSRAATSARNHPTKPADEHANVDIPTSHPSTPIIAILCPSCSRKLEVPVTDAGKTMRCPECKSQLVVPLIHPANSALRHCRFLSLPWLLTICLLGLLPWSEVSCNSREVSIRVTQSGYQAVFGGVSTPLGIGELLAEERHEQDKQSLLEAVKFERSDFLMSASPFLVVFWIALLFMIGLAIFVPLGSTRRNLAIGFLTVAALVLVIQALVSLPLERRIAHHVAEQIRRDPNYAKVALLTLTSGKTAWFWLTFVFLGFATATEITLGAFKGLHRPVPVSTALIFVGLFIPLFLTGIIAQVILREVGIGGLEAKIHQIRQIEQEQAARAEAARLEREQRQRDEQQRRQRLLYEQQEQERQRQKALRELEERDRQRRQELEAERARVEEERRRREAEERAAAEKTKREREAKEAADAEQRTRRAEEAEVQRKKDLESRGLAYYPKPSSTHKGKDAKEWFDSYMERPTDKVVRQRTIEALESLREEGMPFLVQLLQYYRKKDMPVAIDNVLRAMKPQLIHFNDLRAVVDCLDEFSCKDFTRMMALEHLAKRKESKKYLRRIKSLAEDLMNSAKYGPDAKELVEKIGSNE